MLDEVSESRKFINTQKRRGLLRQNEFVTNIIKGKTQDKKEKRGKKSPILRISNIKLADL